MVRPGYHPITIKDAAYFRLKKIKEDEQLSSIPETIRMLIRDYEKQKR